MSGPVGKLSDVEENNRFETNSNLSSALDSHLIRVDQVWTQREDKYSWDPGGAPSNPGIGRVKVLNARFPSYVIPKSLG